MEKWMLELNRSEPSVFTIDDNNMTSFVDLKARFLQQTYAVNTMITVEVIVRYLNMFSYTEI